MLQEGIDTIHFPGILVLPYSLLVQGSITCAVALLTVPSGKADIAIGVLGILLFAVPVVLVCLITTKLFKCAACEKEKTPAAHYEHFIPGLRLFVLLVEPTTGWIDNSSTHFKQKYYHLFADYRVPWYLTVEVGLSALQGAVLGARAPKRDVCVTQTSLLLALNVISLTTILKVWPHHTNIGNAFSCIATTCQLLMATVATAGVVQQTQQLDAAVDYIAMVANFCCTVNTIISTIMIVIHINRKIAQRCHPQRETDPASSQPPAVAMVPLPTQPTINSVKNDAAAPLLVPPAILGQSSDSDESELCWMPEDDALPLLWTGTAHQPMKCCALHRP